MAGATTPSDIYQLGELLAISPLVVRAVVFIFQTALLVFLVHWTCSAGAKGAVKQEVRERRRRKTIWRDINPKPRRLTIH